MRADLKPTLRADTSANLNNLLPLTDSLARVIRENWMRASYPALADLAIDAICKAIASPTGPLDPRLFIALADRAAQDAHRITSPCIPPGDACRACDDTGTVTRFAFDREGNDQRQTAFCRCKVGEAKARTAQSSLLRRDVTAAECDRDPATGRLGN